MTRDGPQVQVSTSGDTVDVELTETPSTGYRWHLAEGTTAVSLVGASYVDATSSRPVAGGSGTRVFHLSLLAPRPFAVQFLLRQPWAPESDADERRIVSFVDSPPPPAER